MSDQPDEEWIARQQRLAKRPGSEIAQLRQQLELANWRGDKLERENELLKKKLMDVEAYFQSGRR